MPPRERQHEELGGLGVSSGLRAASGEDGTRGGWFGELFHTLGRDGTRKEGLGCVWRFFAEKCYFAL